MSSDRLYRPVWGFILIFSGMLVMGTDACREDYFFASKVSIPTASPTPTRTPDDDDDDDDLTPVPTATFTSTATPLGTATSVTAVLEAISELHSRGGELEAEDKPIVCGDIPSNWLGKIYAGKDSADTVKQLCVTPTPTHLPVDPIRDLKK